MIGRIAALPLQRFQFGAFEGNRRAANGRRPARAVPAVQNKNCENNPMHSRKPFPARGWMAPGNALTDRDKKAALRNRPAGCELALQKRPRADQRCREFASRPAD
ncbi:hypothetical protein [Bradyrhizobium zhanjiangense]|uniref:hypothetical protein n=1 Tax=Bradyrhizobium zhanjiangense TaxID=1325107 RepID=UPI001FE025F9|nr:hypothetical protein [Bradyrhizobium zhanjiangense]